MTIQSSLTLPRNLQGRSIHYKIIPTVYNLKNMIQKLKLVNGDVQQLKPWEKRSFQAYHVDRIKHEVLTKPEEEVIKLLREHILSIHPNDLGASCIDIYLVAYVAENYGVGKDLFFNYIYKNGISEKENSANAIWQVGKGDGVYLGLLHDDGSVKDWAFFEQWINGQIHIPEVICNNDKNLIEAFNKDEFKGLAIDTYINKKTNVIREVAEKSFTISYKKRRVDGSATIKFATIAVLYGQPTLILHIGKKADEVGLTFQQKIDEMIGLTYIRNKDQTNEKTHEVFIRIDWLDDLDSIFPFIDYAYENRD